MRSHLTIFHNVVNITLNRHHGVLCQLQINQIYPEVQQLLQIYRWLAAFRNIAVLSLSSILYLAVSLLCWALPYMTHFRRLARTELDDLSLAESEDLEKMNRTQKRYIILFCALLVILRKDSCIGYPAPPFFLSKKRRNAFLRLLESLKCKCFLRPQP